MGAVSRVSDWARSVMGRAALSSRGQSVRTFERRLKRLTGQTKRTLDFFATFDELHRIAATEPDAAPADIAAKAGFADQSQSSFVTWVEDADAAIATLQQIGEERVGLHKILCDRFFEPLGSFCR